MCCVQLGALSTQPRAWHGAGVVQPCVDTEGGLDWKPQAAADQTRPQISEGRSDGPRNAVLFGGTNALEE